MSTKAPRCVLVTGAGGLLGGRLAELLGSEFTVRGAVRRSPAPPGVTALTLDLLDEPGLPRAFDAAAPDAVVHAAALAQPDACERDPDTARRVNVEAVERLARLCHVRGVRLVALSTDLVFDGMQGGRGEADAPAPISVYGRTKLAGEHAALDAHPDAAVVRVALVAGRGHGPRGSASETVAWALRTGTRPRLFVDRWRTPADPRSLADLLARLLRHGGTGIYHCGGPERVSRHELGLRVAGVLGLDAAHIDAVTNDDVPQVAARPRDVSLLCGRARRELHWTPLDLDEAVRDGRLEPPGGAAGSSADASRLGALGAQGLL